MTARRSSLAFVAAASLVMGWGTPALADPPPPPTPFIEAYISSMNQMVFGHDWSDPTVDVAVNGTTVATGVTFPYWTDLAPGDDVVVTGQPSGFVASVTIADHTLTDVDLTADTAAGTATPDPAYDFAIWATEPSSPRLTPTFNSADHTWAVDFGGAGYDLHFGPGLQLRQADAEGDATVTTFNLPNPMVELWDTHGVAASGWQANSPLTLTIDNPSDGEPPMEWGVSTNSEGSYWDPMPEGWSPLQPGWIATATGDVPYVGTVTKTLAVPDPITVPEFNGSVVSDTVPGELTDLTVGPGSQAQLIAYCEGGTDQGTTRFAMTDPTTGFFSLDMSVWPLPDGDFGDQCSGPIQNLLYRLYDTDGDMWQAWWATETHPQLEVFADLVNDGDWVDTAGSGWDLGTVALVQCKTDFGPPLFPEGCDPATRTDVLTSPGDNWPYDLAVFDSGFGVQATLNTELGVVDCTSTSCAVVAFEPWRPEAPPRAWVGLTFAPNVDVSASINGMVSTVTGAATVSGWVSATAPTEVFVSGELRQRFGRTRVVVGWFQISVTIDEPNTLVRWSAVVNPQTGQAFGSGKAGLTVLVDLGYENSPSDMDAVTVSLTTAKKRR